MALPPHLFFSPLFFHCVAVILFFVAPACGGMANNFSPLFFGFKKPTDFLFSFLVVNLKANNKAIFSVFIISFLIAKLCVFFAPFFIPPLAGLCMFFVGAVALLLRTATTFFLNQSNNCSIFFRPFSAFDGLFFVRKPDKFFRPFLCAATGGHFFVFSVRFFRPFFRFYCLASALFCFAFLVLFLGFFCSFVCGVWGFVFVFACSPKMLVGCGFSLLPLLIIFLLLFLLYFVNLSLFFYSLNIYSNAKFTGS